VGFAVNFYKGALGVWMRMVLIVGLCVSVSTELGGIITALCIGLVYLGGLSRDFIAELAARINVGGGPLEAAYRIVTRKHLSAPVEDPTLTAAFSAPDAAFSFLMKGLLPVLPDVDRFDFTDRVANGFNIALIQQDILPTFVMLVGYLIPWALLSFYLIRSREIAGAH
jgi:hypothetical protein